MLRSALAVAVVTSLAGAASATAAADTQRDAVVVSGQSASVEDVKPLAHTSRGMIFAGEYGYHLVSAAGVDSRFYAAPGLNFQSCSSDVTTAGLGADPVIAWRNVATGASGTRMLTAGRRYLGPSAKGWLELAVTKTPTGSAVSELHDVDAQTGDDATLLAVSDPEKPDVPPIVAATVCSADHYGIVVIDSTHRSVVHGSFAGGSTVVMTESPSTVRTLNLVAVSKQAVLYGHTNDSSQVDLTRQEVGGAPETWTTGFDRVRGRGVMTESGNSLYPTAYTSLPMSVVVRPAGGSQIELPGVTTAVPGVDGDTLLAGVPGAESGGLFSVSLNGSRTRLWGPDRPAARVSNLSSSPGRVVWSDDRAATTTVFQRRVDPGDSTAMGVEDRIVDGLADDTWSRGLDDRGARVGANGRRVAWVDGDGLVVDDGVGRTRLPDYRPLITSLSGHRWLEDSGDNTASMVTDLLTGQSKHFDRAQAMSGQTGLYVAGTRAINLVDVGTGATRTQAVIPGLSPTAAIEGVAISPEIYAWRWTEIVDRQPVAHVGWRNRSTRTEGELTAVAGSRATSLSLQGQVVAVGYHGVGGDSAAVVDTGSRVMVELPRATAVRVGASGVVWVDGFSGQAHIAPLPGSARRPFHEGNAKVRASFTALAPTPWTGEWALSESLTSCTVSITDAADVTVRVLPCDAHVLAYGEAVAFWDGRDSAGRYATSGTYRWTLRAAGAGGEAVDVDGSTAPVTGSIAVTDDRYAPLDPARVLDTRSGLGAPKKPVPGGGEVVVQLAGRGGVPLTNVATVVLNLTVVSPALPGYATVYPDRGARPGVSSLNYAKGQTSTNQVVAPVGPGGRVTVFTSASAEMLVDVAGYYPNNTNFVPVVAARLLDTRQRVRVPAGGLITVPVVGRAAVPGSGVAAVALNVTAAGPDSNGYLTVYPAGSKRPLASNVNFDKGSTVAGLSLTKVGQGGAVSIYSSVGTDVLVDVSGWYPTASDLRALDPARVLDTRNGLGVPGGRSGSVNAGGAVSVQVTGRGGVPNAGVKAVLLNVTAVGPSRAGYLSVFPAGQGRPSSSVVNHRAGQTVANSVIAKVGRDGKVDVYSSGGANVIVDVQGYVLN